MAGYESDLGELRWHWGSAYRIQYWPGPCLWLAQRRDTGETLKADSAGALHSRIVADYTARPVPRLAARCKPLWNRMELRAPARTPGRADTRYGRGRYGH